MKTKISPVLLCLLSVMALVLVCFLVMPSEAVDPHAGHDHATATTADPHAGHDHAQSEAKPSQTLATHNKSADESYVCTKNEDGLYSYEVTSRNGNKYTSNRRLEQEPVFTALSEDVLMVSTPPHESNNLTGWAIFYDVRRDKFSDSYEHVLANTDNTVAYLHGEQGEFTVVVCYPFQDGATTRTKLEGLSLSETGNPAIEYTLHRDNILQITYNVGDAEKVVYIDMN